MVHDHAPVVSCVPYSPGGWFIPLATTQLSGAPAAHVSRQPEICTVAPGERLGRVVATNVSDSGALPVGAAVVDVVVVGAAAVVVVGGAVVVGAEVVEVVVVGAAVVDVVVVGAAAVAVVGGVSSAGSPAAAKVVGGLLVVVVVVEDAGDGSSAAVVVVVVVVDEGEVSGSSAEAASTGSDELDESPRLAIAHTPRPPIISPLTRKTILISPPF